MNSIVLQEVKPGMHAQLIHTHRQFKVQYICHSLVLHTTTKNQMKLQLQERDMGSELL